MSNIYKPTRSLVHGKSSDIYRGLVWSFVPGKGLIDESTRMIRPSSSAAGTYLETRYGLGYAEAEGGQTFTSASTSHLSFAGDFTIFVYFFCNKVSTGVSGADDYANIVTRSTYVSEVNNQGWGFIKGPQADGSNGTPRGAFNTYKNNGVANYRLFHPTTFAANTFYRAILYQSGTTKRIWYEGGGLTSTISAAPVAAASANLVLGGFSATNEFYVLSAAMWNRPLNQINFGGRLRTEMDELFENPYYLHTPVSAPFFFVTDPSLPQTHADDLNSWGEAQQLGHGLIHADDAANLSDAASQLLTHHLSPTENLNSWADAAAYTAFEIALGLSQAVADSTQKLTGPTSSRFSWKDGIFVSMTAADVPFFISIDDLDSYNDDDVQISLAVFFNNSGPISAFDSMMYNWADSVSYDLIANGAIFDSLLPFQDVAAATLAHLLAISDTLSLSDALAISFNSSSASVSDTLSMSDATAQTFTVVLTVGIFDSLDYWNDYVASTAGTSRIQYLRRYINDVING